MGRAGSLSTALIPKILRPDNKPQLLIPRQTKNAIHWQPEAGHHFASLKNVVLSQHKDVCSATVNSKRSIARVDEYYHPTSGQEPLVYLGFDFRVRIARR